MVTRLTFGPPPLIAFPIRLFRGWLELTYSFLVTRPVRLRFLLFLARAHRKSLGLVPRQLGRQLLQPADVDLVVELLDLAHLNGGP